MELRLRVAAPDDAELFADLETAAHPDDPSDPVVTRAFLEGGLDDWDVTHLLVLAGERPAGVHVSTGFTGTDPDHRGLGIARAVKLESLGQAVELGVPRVRADNDSENAPILHINETLGYRPLPPWRTFARSIPAAAPPRRL